MPTVEAAVTLPVRGRVSFAPPTNVGMKMVDGPWFFEMFGGGWRFTEGEHGTRVTWRYNFRCHPSFLRPFAHPVGRWLLGREIRRRINGYAVGCTDEIVLAEAKRIASRY